MYVFKEWLSFEEAAAWLSDSTGTNYESESLLVLALKGRVPVHYWPTDNAQIALFKVEPALPNYKPLLESFVRLDHVNCEAFCLVDGPVPIHNFQVFFTSLQNKVATGTIGIGTSIDGEETYGCYRLGADEKPKSVTLGEYELLIHLSDLEQVKQSLPMPPICKPYALAIGTTTMHGFPETFPLARSSADWRNYPDSDLPIAAEENAQAELPPAVSTPSIKHDEDRICEQESRPEPLLRALGLAAHLIAELGKQLDEHEQIPTRKKKLQKGTTPNVSRISEALAKEAAALRLEGHNYKGAGFQKLLTKALRELQ